MRRTSIAFSNLLYGVLLTAFLSCTKNAEIPLSSNEDSKGENVTKEACAVPEVSPAATGAPPAIASPAPVLPPVIEPGPGPSSISLMGFNSHPPETEIPIDDSPLCQVGSEPLAGADPLLGVWQEPVLVSVPNENISRLSGPVLDVNAVNDAVATWLAPPDIFGDIKANSYNYGSGWGDPITISSTALNQFGDRIYIGQGDPHIALNDVGKAVTVWEGSEFVNPEQENLEGVFSSIRDSSGVWSPVQRISLRNLIDSDFDPENPIVAINNSGTAVVIWNELRDNNRYMMTSFLQSNNLWSTPEQLDGPFRGLREDDADIQINEAGDVVAVWQIRDILTTTIRAATFNHVTQTWSATVTLEVKNDAVGATPKAGIDAAGNGVAVWPRGAIGGEVAASYFSVTSGWNAPQTIFETSVGRVLNPHVVMDTLGNATAAWSFETDNTGDVYSSFLPFGQSWTPATIVSAGTTNNFIDVGLGQRPLFVNFQGIVYLIYNSDQGLISAAHLMLEPWQEPVLIFNTPSGAVSSITNIGGGYCGFAITLWAERENGIATVQSSVNFGTFSPPRELESLEQCVMTPLDFTCDDIRLCCPVL